MTTISKLEGARRNLAAAVRLFFESGDAIPVHTLAAAAQAVIRDVAKAHNLSHTDHGVTQTTGSRPRGQVLKTMKT